MLPTAAHSHAVSEIEGRRAAWAAARLGDGEEAREGVDGILLRKATGYSTDRVFADVRFKITHALREVRSGGRFGCAQAPAP